MGEDYDEGSGHRGHGNDIPMTLNSDVWGQAAYTSPRGSPMSMDAVGVFDEGYQASDQPT